MSDKKAGFCPNCGKEIQEGATFCLHCMKSFTDKVPLAKPGRQKRGLIAVIAAASTAALLAGALFFFFVFQKIHKNPDVDPGGSVSSVSEGTDTDTGTGADTKDDGSDSKTETKETSGEKADGKGQADPGSAEVSRDDVPDEGEQRSAPSQTTPAQTGSSGGSNTSRPSSETSRTSASTQSSGGAQTTQTRSGTSSSGTSAHVHTDSCYEWVVDVPYSPAVYKDVKVIDVPYKAAVYGERPVNYTEYKYRLYFYTVSGTEHRDDMYFNSTADFEAWIESSGAVRDASWSDDGRVTLDGIRWFFSTTKTGYTATKYEYGLISPEQPEESHTERQLVSPEQEEVGHYELVCGY